jgi:hypothetical protein
MPLGVSFGPFKKGHIGITHINHPVRHPCVPGPLHSANLDHGGPVAGAVLDLEGFVACWTALTVL